MFLLLPGVCPSVCQSDTFVYCIQTAKYIVKLLSRHGSGIILVFLDREPRYPIPWRTPSVRAHNTRRWEKIAITVYLGNGTR